ncbi:MAG: shikimate kinase [Anaerolineae bacterium]
MYSTIILIGPVSAGKSTVAALLADKLHMPHVSIDDVRWGYYAEIGYDNAEASRIANSDEGMLGLLRYWKPFEAYAVERVLPDHPNSVIDFGAGHSFYDDEALFDRVQNALAPYPNVIMLLPSPDLDESARILNDRFRTLLQREVGLVDEGLLDLNATFVKHPSRSSAGENRRLHQRQDA